MDLTAIEMTTNQLSMTLENYLLSLKSILKTHKVHISYVCTRERIMSPNFLNGVLKGV